jgi:hypothetical protein
MSIRRFRLAFHPLEPLRSVLWALLYRLVSRRAVEGPHWYAGRFGNA